MSNPKSPTILIISHDATRTGAPILLINLARLLKEQGYKIEFLLKRGGELVDEFKSIGHCYIYYVSKGSNLISRITNKITGSHVSHLDIRALNWKDYLFVLSNTITNGDILPVIRENYKGKIVSYIHELEMAASFFTTPNDVERLLSSTDHFLTPSYAVKNFLIKKFGLNPGNVEILSYYIPGFSGHDKRATKPSLEDNNFIVGAAGTPDWRKSPDLFVLVAATVFRKLPDAAIKFIWKGVSATAFQTETERLRFDVRKLHLEEKVLFEPSSGEMSEFYGSLDLFLLTSREDPYPLVVLEAAAASVPAICFIESGGAIEFIESSNGGSGVPYLNIEAMADEIIYYFKNSQQVNEKGNNAKLQLEQTHQNKNFIIGQFENILKTLDKS